MVEYRSIIPVRVVVAILIFFGSFTCYMLRVDISIALINISEPSNYSIRNNFDCQENLTYAYYRAVDTRAINIVTKEWKPLNPIMVAALLSTYNLGFSFSIMLSEPLADEIGVVKTIGYSTLMSAALTLFCPLAYKTGVFVFVAVRFLIGFLSGFVFPLLHILILKWSPMKERNVFALSLYGASIGIIMTYPVGAYVMEHWSWEWITYILGTFAIIWATVWLFYVTDLPIQHRYITRDELQLIQFRRISVATTRIRKRVPWCKIIKAAPMWALFILLWGNTWNLSFYIDYMPLYFYNVLKYDVLLGSSLASLPILARMVFSWACLPLAKCFILGRWFSSIGHVRKFFTIFSHILPAVIQLSLLYIMFCNRLASTIVPIVFLGFNGAIIGGGSLNTVDLTPHYAANVYNAMQALLCFAGICMPYVVAFILLSFNNHVKGWMIVLAVNASLYLIGGIIFLIFGSGSVQEWDFASVRGVVSFGLLAENVDEYEEMEMN